MSNRRARFGAAYAFRGTRLAGLPIGTIHTIADGAAAHSSLIDHYRRNPFPAVTAPRDEDQA